MFAHYLLPALALLLLATVNNCTGSTENVSFYKKQVYYIPNHRCDSVLHMAQKEGLRCDGIAFISWVDVKIWDHKPDIQINLYDSFNIVQVVRQQDCSDVGLVSIRVGCQYYQGVLDNV